MVFPAYAPAVPPRASLAIARGRRFLGEHSVGTPPGRAGRNSRENCAHFGIIPASYSNQAD